MRPAIFFDRDGVINIDTHYLHKIEEFEFTPGLLNCLKKVAPHFSLFIITNQSGIERGFFTENEYQKLTLWYVEKLRKEGIHIESVYHCPHAPETHCTCRKPSPELILKAANEYSINLSKSWMVGDKYSDLECGHNAKIPNIVFFNNGQNPFSKTPHFSYFTTDSMDTLSTIILSKV